MNRPRSMVMVAAVMAAACAALAGCTSSAAHSVTPKDGTSGPRPGAAAASGGAGAGASQLQAEYVSAIGKVLPSVVLIRTQRDLGSGIVVDADGDIVTNDHVVGTASRFEVALSGGTRPLPAMLVGAYPPDDLAVIRVSGAKNLHPATFADSSGLQDGDIVLAIGN